MIVVVDATFGHRIATSERQMFDEAVAHGELVTPPAGAIGRGDAFVLRVAERVNGQVLSNDSFQEFHADHSWLFEDGRLMGGKPVPGVGWIFTPRLPVRGPRSRAATSTPTGRGRRGRAEPDGQPPGRSRRTSKVAEAAIALATNEAATATKLVRAPKSPKVGDVIRVPETGGVIKVAKTTKAAKVVKGAKATKEPAKTVKEAKSAKAAKEPGKAIKTAKAAKAVKGTKAAKEPAKTAKAVKGAKATKEPAKTVKEAKTAKVAKEPAKAIKTAKAATEPAKTTRTATKTEARKGAKDAATVETGAAEVGGETTTGARASSATRRGRRGRGTAAPVVQAAIEAATEEALGSSVAAVPAPRPPRARGRSQEPTAATAPTAVNDPLTFLTFVSEHPLGSSVLGTVSSFVSHGAMVDVSGMSCYLPLTGLGDPPPRRAREVVAQGEQRSFVVVALDPPRRGAELALAERAKPATAEPVRGSSRRTKRAGRTAS